jgi:hypothetical protein
MQPFTRTLFSTFYRIRYENYDSRNESEFSEMSRNIYARDISKIERFFSIDSHASIHTNHYGVP